MKWFKHYSDASNSHRLSAVEEKMGLIGYAAYFKIVELCAADWDGKSPPIFTFTEKQIQNKIRMKSRQTDLVLTLFSEQNLFQITRSKEKVIIKFDKLLQIKDNHSKNLQVTGKSLAPRTEQNRTEQNRTEESKEEKAEPQHGETWENNAAKNNFGIYECHDLWERLGTSDCMNLKPSKVTPGHKLQEFANLKVKYLKTEADWEAYFRSLNDTEFADKKGFSLVTALKEETYLNHQSSLYGSIETQTPEGLWLPK